MSEQGNLSINSENMFPIIKKWLYSDHDIFVREVISNGCDAITKRKKLALMGECELPDDYEGRIDVAVNPNEKMMTFTDNGLGMTADEVREYINNIAFSGAKDFLEKYKDKATSDQIIGHFGLGFYSVFMVSGDVEIDTLSYQQGAEPVHWECDGGYSYTMDRGSRTQPGTTITLHLTDDCVEFANYYKAKETIQKYCSFMPYEIYLRDETTTDTETIKESERRPDDVVIEELPPEEKKEEKAADKPIENDDPNKADSAMDAEKKADGEEAGAEKPAPEKRYKIRRRPELLNDTHPLWTKTPKDCTDEEYKEFYRKTFHDYREPLFWIHLNMDYPFNLKGILYFPKINLEYENAEGVIKLYNNQVFVADNIKEVIPEYLMLLKGVIDCPDLPLNVSRSALQNDGFAQKISDYITKKVADKLNSLMNKERETYEVQAYDIGNLYHAALEHIFRTVSEDKASISDYPEEKLGQLIDGAVEEVSDNYQHGMMSESGRNLYLMHRLRRITGVTAQVLAEQLRRGDFHVAELEKEFTMVRDGIRLNGRIDRVDLLEEKDKVYVRIIDYKTGSSTVYDAGKIYDGVQLQLAIYLESVMRDMANKHHGKEIVPAAMFYYHIDDPVLLFDETKTETEYGRDRLVALKPSGLMNSDGNILKLMDHDFLKSSDILPVSVGKNGFKCKKGADVASTEQFRMLTNYADKKIRDFGDRIREGDITVSPIETGDHTLACTYCPYHSICSFDGTLDGYRYRPSTDLNQADIFQKMQEDTGNDQSGHEDK